MHSLFFWRNWRREHRLLWYIAFGAFIVSLALLWIHYFIGPAGIMGWEHIQEQKTIETTVHSFQLGPFSLSVPGESYAIFEYLGGTDLVHNVWASYAFLAIFTISILMLLTIVTALERFWYFAGMSLFIILVASLRLDVLAVLGQRGLSVPVTVIALFTLVSFYFRYFRQHASLAVRFGVFFAMAFAVGLVVVFFSVAEFPFLHLVVTAYPAGLILAILFIIMVAHEILVSFVYISGKGAPENSAKHFSIISFIYLINVLLTCLHEMGVIDWNFLYINLYLLLTASALLGVWGFKLREPQYDNIFLFEPAGALFFAALGAITFGISGQLLANSNDAALKVVRDVIIFSHTGYGIIFLTYFFSNFLVMMAENRPVYRILYKPNRMPYFTFRLAGLIATLAFVFYSNWREYVYHGTAGFYNYVADLYRLQDNEAFAQSFYEQSRARAFQNNRANYALAIIRSGHLDLERAKRHYELANGKRPTPYSLVNEGNISLWTRQYFDAIATYRNARTKLAESPVLDNNTGYAFAKVHALDSAGYYLGMAREDKLTRASAEANFFAMAATEMIPINPDSVLSLFDTGSRAVGANALALASFLGQKLQTGYDPLSLKQLDLYSATYLNNYIINRVKELDTTWTSEAYRIARDSVNASYSEALQASLAHAFYHQGQVHRAIRTLGDLAYLTQNYQGKFNYIIGLWGLEQGDARFAADYFQYAEAANYKSGKFYRAIALTEAGNTNEALVAWDTLARTGDENEQRIAVDMLRVLLQNPADAIDLPDPQKYQYCRYRLGLSDTLQFRRLVNSFRDVNYKAQALLDLSRKFYRADRIIPAIRFFTQISGLELSNQKLYDEVLHFELLMLASRGEVGNLATQINKGVQFDRDHYLHRLLYSALIAEASGDTATADQNYGVLATANPFFEEGIISAANFFRSKDPKSLKAYTILTEAIYINARSVRLLRAYAAEASRQGFDEYAASAIQTLMQVEAGMR